MRESAALDRAQVPVHVRDRLFLLGGGQIEDAVVVGPDDGDLLVVEVDHRAGMDNTAEASDATQCSPCPIATSSGEPFRAATIVSGSRLDSTAIP